MKQETRLRKSGKVLERTAEKCIEMANDFAEIEEELKMVKARIYNLDRVINLKNQVMRDAEVDLIMQGDQRFIEIYRKHRFLSGAKRRAWYMYELAKELNANERAVLNHITYRGGELNE